MELFPGGLLADDILDEPVAMKKNVAKDRQQSWNRGRSDVVGGDHKQVRIAIRAELEPGYFISSSGKKGIKVLHRLGQCHMMPGVDCMTYEYAGTSWDRFVRNGLHVVREVEELRDRLGILSYQHLLVE